MWPGRLYDTPDFGRAYWDLSFYKGNVIKAYELMASAHKTCRHLIRNMDRIKAHEKSTHPALVGVAHNVAYYQAGFPTFVNQPATRLVHQLVNLDFLFRIAQDMDYIGIVGNAVTGSFVFHYLELLWNRPSDLARIRFDSEC
jgi:hypothetical protein